MTLRFFPRITVRRPERWLNSIHWRRSGTRTSTVAPEKAGSRCDCRAPTARIEKLGVKQSKREREGRPGVRRPSGAGQRAIPRAARGNELRHSHSTLLRATAAGRVPLHPGHQRGNVPVPATGPCASTPATAPREESTAATATCSSRARRASRWRSTCRPRWATTPTTRSPAARSGRSGVAIATHRRHADLTRGPSARPSVSISMTINSTAAILLALLLAVARERGIAWKDLSGTVQNDMLKEYTARGTYIFPPRPSLKIATDIFEFCGREVPQWNTISVSGYHIREAGSTAVQEVAFTLANGIAYVEAAIARGLAGRLLRSAHLVLLQRALELLRGDREVPRGALALGGDHARALRRAGSALAAAALPRADRGLDADRPAARRQRRARGAAGAGRRPRRHAVAPHQRLRRGAGAADRARGSARAPHAAGARRSRPAWPTSWIRSAAPRSWRSGPTEIRLRARALIEKIDSLGGAVAAIEGGWVQREIEEAAYAAQREVEEGRRIVVGMNAFREDGAAATPVLEVDPADRARSDLATRGLSARRGTRRRSRPRSPESSADAGKIET